MKLKNKVIFSFLCIVMMLFLFGFVDVCSRYAGEFVENRTYASKSEDETACMKYSLASSKTQMGFVISNTKNGYLAKGSFGEMIDGDLSRLISFTEADGAVIEFDNVEYSGSITLSKRAVICGELRLSSGNLNLAADAILIDGLDLILSSGSAVVKSGSVNMVSGSVRAESAPAFVLNYSAAASLFVSGGEIHGNTPDGAIVCTMGCIGISGGKISNPYGYAISNEGTLSLSGEAEISGFEFDVKTKNPIELSGERGYFTSSLKVLYDALFERGSITQVFRGCDSESGRYIEMYDASAEPMALTYFESSEYTEEENFLAVYLPYAVKFYSNGSLYHTEYFLSGDTVYAPEVPSVCGYDFCGWYTDQAKDTAYVFGGSEYCDFSLFAGYELTSPKFILNSKSFTYDGTERLLSFESYTHPLSEFGSFSFEWYKDSEVVRYSSYSIPLCTVSDSGAYKCKLTFSYNGDFVSVMTPEVDVLIEKATVVKPQIPSYEYTGSRISPNIPTSNLYSYDFSSSVDVGSYPVTFTLADSNNYKWSDSDTKFTSSSYEITRAINEIIGEITVRDAFVGEAVSIRAKVKFGEIKILYSSDGISFSETLPTEPGEYFLKLFAEGCANYSELESEAVKFSILEELPVGIKIDKLPYKTDYRAFEKLLLDGAEFSVTYNSGKVEKIDNSYLEVKYRTGSCFHAEDSGAVIFFGGVSVPVTVNISLAEYDVSQIVFNDGITVYNGRRQSLEALCEIVGEDGIPLAFKVTGGGINAGQYSVTLSFESESINYRIPSPIVKTLTISPLEVSVKFDNLTFNYDGSPKIPSATAVGAEGRALPLTVSGIATDAGTYTAAASISDPNYRLRDAEAVFRILKADLDFSSVVWNESSFVYDGNTHSVSVSGLPREVSFIGYANSSFTDAGKYTATAAILYDTKNYNTPPALTHEWEILPADYDFSNCIFLDSEYIFDGDIHYPALVGSMPVGADGSSPDYAYSTGVTHVCEGRVKITVSFFVSSKNYNLPNSIEAYVKILPKPVTVVWENLNFVYDGTAHIPTAYSDECSVKVTGAVNDAGEYTAYAESLDSDYTVNNSAVTFVIARAANSWVKIPAVGKQFEGKTPAPYAEALSGEVMYSYYSDYAMTDLISPPKTPGKYYMLAYVPESKNYNYLAYLPIELEILEIVPISFSAELICSSLVAMNTLGEGDVALYLLNNDGSKTKLTLDDISIEYENGESLLAADRHIVFSYGEFRVKCAISVEKARYDMSGAYWRGTEHVYSGSKCEATLEGLPDGVYVKEYITNTAVDAGEYTLAALLGYDSANYLPPEAPCGKLTVAKREIKTPDIPSAVYDGTVKTVKIPEGALVKTEFSGAVNAGIYEIVFSLTDNKNYTFSDSGTAVFEITKRPITAEISEGGEGYSIVFGNVCGSDNLSEEFYSEDGWVYIRISNPNYELTVIPAKEDCSELVWSILLLSLLFILLTLGGVIAYSRRAKIIAAFSSLMSKAAPRKCDIATAKKSDNADEKNRSEMPLETLMAVDEEHANSLISDSLAKNLVSDSEDSVETEGRRRAIVNVDTISENFAPGDSVDINSLKEKKLIPGDAGYIKILARGVIDKPLTVTANSFSLSAVKMIALTGGVAKRAHTVKKRG